MQNFSTLISVSIGGKRLFSFKSLELKQAINEHHTFTLTLDFEAAGSRYVHNLKDNAQWLGKNMTVHAGEKKQTVFLGIITNVSLHKQDSELGCLVIKGYSTTYLLENAPDFHSWNERTLESIVGELTKDAGVQAKIRPEHTAEVNYECQYNETDFDFIRRLAKQYGEWLYYDGKSLVFGKPDKEEPVRLEYGIDLYSLDIGLQTLARPLKVFSYHATDDNTLIENSPNRPDGQSLLGYKAFNASMEMFKTPSNQAAMPRIRYMKQLEAYTRKAQQSAAAETHYVEGTSSNALLKVGSVVRLRSSVIGDFGALSKENLGDFIITEITHSVSEGSYYRNRFKAIPSGTLTLPAPDVSMPIAGPQTATVVSNDDPKEAGHVRVQMNWQTGNMQTGWIRVMTPDAGSSDKVNTNRGFVFIPEVGDKVLVGFRNGDPNRPYVMGSLFNGSTAAGGGSNNHKKSITSRSGSTITLDDDAHTILISTSRKNNIFIDEKNGTVSILSAEQVDVKTKHVNIEATEDMKIDVGKDLEISVGGNIKTAVGGDRELSVAENQNISVGGTSNESIAGNMKVTAKDMMMTATDGDAIISAASKALLQGGEDAKVSKG